MVEAAIARADWSLVSTLAADLDALRAGTLASGWAVVKQRADELEAQRAEHVAKVSPLVDPKRRRSPK